MKTSKVSALGKLARKPWFMAWELLEKALYRGKEYALQFPTGRRVYTPWFHDAATTGFMKLYRGTKAAGPVTQTPDRAYILYQFAKASARLQGDMAECGVFQGGSAHLIAATLDLHGKGDTRLHLFDTFAGAPSVAVPERDAITPGAYSNTSVAGVGARLSPYGERCQLHPGLIPDTFAEVAHVPQYALVNIDVDLYPTNVACCEWFWPRMAPGGVLIFNDFGFYPYRKSTRKAVEEFFADRPEEPIVLPTGQAFIIKPGA